MRGIDPDIDIALGEVNRGIVCLGVWSVFLIAGCGAVVNKEPRAFCGSVLGNPNDFQFCVLKRSGALIVAVCGVGMARGLGSSLGCSGALTGVLYAGR